MGVLDGRRALVTGGSRGIGRAVVERLAWDGAAVVFSFRGNASAAAEVERAVVGAGGSVHSRQAELGDVTGVRALFSEAERVLGGLDIVVLSAGVADGDLIAQETEEVYDRVMAVNAKSTFFGLQESARRLSDGGRIVTLSSVNTVLAEPGAAVYSASKAAIEQFSIIASKELGPRGIAVNVVSPGATDTDMLREENSAADVAAMAAMSPLGRLGEPADVADVIAFLVGPDGGWMTGQNLRASGGLA